MTDHDPARAAFMSWISSQAHAATDYELDELIASTQARRQVASAHGRRNLADAYHDAVLVADDVRRARRRLAEEVEDALLPGVDLGEVPE